MTILYVHSIILKKANNNMKTLDSGTKFPLARAPPPAVNGRCSGSTTMGIRLLSPAALVSST